MPIKYLLREPPVGFANYKDADAQLIGEELSRLTARHGGELTPKVALEAARNPRSPLHQHFDWNDKTAAEKFRLDQARSLIRSIRIIQEDDESSEPVYFSIREKHNGSSRSYRRTEEIRSSVRLQAVLLAQAEKDLAAFERRYAVIADVCAMVRAARERLVEKRAELAAQVETGA